MNGRIGHPKGLQHSPTKNDISGFIMKINGKIKTL